MHLPPIIVAALLVSEAALAKNIVIQPGQTIELGRDTITCSAGANPATLVHLFKDEGCRDRRFSFPIDWASKDNTLKNCKAAEPFPTGSMDSYSLDGTCHNFVGFASGCKEIVEVILGR